ncbi:MAG: protein BatD [Candidatus Omnitrophica bacterium]|nr:protein BatD [Candidatus Omnitrophota bacterium]
MKILLFSTVMFLSVALGLEAGEVVVTASADRNSAKVSDEIHLTIRIEGAQGSLQAPRLPGFDGFDTFYTGRSSQISFVNGRSSSSVEFSYVLVPQKPGRFTLKGIEVQVEGRAYTTGPINLEIVEDANQVSRTQTQTASYTSASTGSSQQTIQEPEPVFAPGDENIFVKATVDKTTIFPNEQVLLTYSLYTRYDTRYEGFEEEPGVSGFWIEEFPPEREVKRETVRVGGMRYVKAEIKKLALFPTTAADYTISPGKIKVSIRQEPRATSIFDEFFNDSFFTGGGFFARRENRLLEPPPIALKVVPFPSRGKPEDFKGTVGNFRMSASIDKATVKQDEPVTMTLVIEGEGNIETLHKPDIPELDEFKVYDADTASNLYKSGDVIAGKKTFEVVFIPVKAGNIRIPKLSFSYFNPRLETYQTLYTPEFVLNVTPSETKFKLPVALSEKDEFKKQIKVEGRDIHYIRERMPPRDINVFYRGAIQGILFANILLTLLLGVGLFRDHQERLYARDNALRRRRRAKAFAESRMRRLKSLMHSKDPEKSNRYFDEIGKILTQYLADKFGLSVHGMTEYDLERTLTDTFGSEDPLSKEILELHQICEESRFAKAQVSESLKQRAMKILRETIQRVEKTRR